MIIKNKRGYEGSFMNLFTGIILISLFTVLILNAVLDVGADYGKDTSTVVGGSLSLQNFTGTISNIQRDTDRIQGAFQSQRTFSVIAGIVVEGVFGIGVSLGKMLFTPLFLIMDILTLNLGVPSYVAGVIIALFTISLMIAIWRLIRIGE